MVKFIAGLWIEGQPEGRLTTTSSAPVVAHVSLHSVAQKEAFSAMSPDDADRLRTSFVRRPRRRGERRRCRE